MFSRQICGLVQSARMRSASSRQFSSSSSSSRKAYEQAADQSNSNVAYYGATLAVVVFGVSYASVPLYRMFCQATGFGGTTRRKTIEDKLRDAASLPPGTKAAALARSVTISFNADVAEGMPWRFAPTQKNVVVRPGETTLAFFTAMRCKWEGALLEDDPAPRSGSYGARQ